MAFALFIVGMLGFVIWLLRQRANNQISALAIFFGSIYLYGYLVPNLVGLSKSPYGITVSFFLSISTAMILIRKKAR